MMASSPRTCCRQGSSRRNDAPVWFYGWRTDPEERGFLLQGIRPTHFSGVHGGAVWNGCGDGSTPSRGLRGERSVAGDGGVVGRSELCADDLVVNAKHYP